MSQSPALSNGCKGSGSKSSKIRKLNAMHKGSDSNNSDSEDIQCMEDDSSHHSDLKRPRLTSDQVQYLEKSFEAENKLEPERKKKLATELGLHPRQIAVWFQNRRVRWKTKQMEQAYSSLKSAYNKMSAEFKAVTKDYILLKHDYEDLLSENTQLCSRMARLAARLMEMEQEPSACGDQSEEKNQGNQSQARDFQLGTQSNQGSMFIGLDRASSCRSEVSDVDPCLGSRFETSHAFVDSLMSGTAIPNQVSETDLFGSPAFDTSSHGAWPQKRSDFVSNF